MSDGRVKTDAITPESRIKLYSLNYLRESFSVCAAFQKLASFHIPLEFVLLYATVRGTKVHNSKNTAFNLETRVTRARCRLRHGKRLLTATTATMHIHGGHCLDTFNAATV